MKHLILGALLGLLLLIPQLLTVVAAVAAALLSQPVLVAFALGALARPYLRRPKRWAR
ncbi:hypothetical protein [Streptomyces cupreus]|uniref:Uncharacterized protein n=1 Tax=Streptomyces cupreus TaxID=2759956 RepID=A0A7X1MAS1_9ACTN|nr:hypothetical protein [Streptomyces cupreus]MBC2904013.1 hypothetical protein [Streptomyces cupreus]